MQCNLPSVKKNVDQIGCTLGYAVTTEIVKNGLSSLTFPLIFGGGDCGLQHYQDPTRQQQQQQIR